MNLVYKASVFAVLVGYTTASGAVIVKNVGNTNIGVVVLYHEDEQTTPILLLPQKTVTAKAIPIALGILCNDDKTTGTIVSVEKKGTYNVQCLVDGTERKILVNGKELSIDDQSG